MEIVRRSLGRDDDLVVRVNSPDATLEDLVRAIAGSEAAAARTYVDGRPMRPDTELASSGLCRGSIFSTEPLEVNSSDGDMGGAGSLQLCVIGGLDAGRVVPLPAGTHSYGRDLGCDIAVPEASVSRRHCEINVGSGLPELRDLGSTGGTWVDGERLKRGQAATLLPSSVVETGAVAFVVRPRRGDDRSMAVDPTRFAGENGEIPFNRPPRQAAGGTPRSVKPPKAPATREKQRFNVIAMIAPAAAGAVMVVTLKSWLYVVIAVLTPVMAVVNWWDSRRKEGRSAHIADRTFRTELESFTEKVGQIVLAERQRREAAHPDLPEILRRVDLPSIRVWERRAGNADYLQLELAHGPLRWQPPIEEAEYGETRAPEVTEVIEAASTLLQVPITADLATGGPVGIVGDRVNVLALARSLLCQAAVLHGPSDLPILVLVDEDRVTEWDWAKWLPHARDLQAGDDRLLLAGEKACNRYVEALLDAAPARRERPIGEAAAMPLFAVVDSDVLTRGKQAPVRDLLKGSRIPATGIVIAPSEDLLPSTCTTVVQCHEVPGEVTVTRPQEGVSHPHVVVAGLSEERARECVRALARFEDPEIKVPGSALPRTVRVGSLLGKEVFEPSEIARRWAAYASGAAELWGEDREAKPPMEGAIGRTETSPLLLDIVNDGPHGLVGGTTGSGKTELLRSVVLGLAASAGPRHLNFVFIDFKGGAGFEKLADLPHAVGLATNLNAELTERLLVCLQAELEYRQRCFRDAPVPVDDLHKYWQVSGEPLPRLLVVVDELAELVAAVPEFTTALIRIGRIGRTLGVHLLLATQRPGGVITTELRENTNYAIALRVRDASNSLDIIGVPDAASIPPRNATGRAFLRVGGEGSSPTLFQSGYSSGTTREEAETHIETAPFKFGGNPEAALAVEPRASSSPPGPTDLERIVDAMAGAFAASGERPPRRPWADALPEQIALDDLLPVAAGTPARARPAAVQLGLADELATQSQHSYGWDLGRGNILFYGVVGSGTTTALATVALAVDRLFPSETAQIYVLDCGAGELTALEPLGSVGAVVTSAETERQARLCRLLLDELKQRKAAPRLVSERAAIFLLVDSFGGLTAAAEGTDLLDDVHRIFSEGPDVGIHVAASADRPQAVPYRLADVAPQKWVMRLTDAADYASFGLPKRSAAGVPPGRAFVAGTTIAVQVGRPSPDLGSAVAAAASRRDPSTSKPPGIGTLPEHVAVEQLLPSAAIGGDVWLLPVGIGNTTLQPFCLRLHRGEHAVVGGPARSGKSSLLRALATLARRAVPECTVLALLGRPASALTAGAPVAEIVESADDLPARVEAAACKGPVLVLVDDAQAISDPTGQLEQLFASTGPGVHAVVAGRTDELRQAFGHWTQAVRKSHTGVALKVSQPSDGDVIGANLPFSRSYDSRPGRGFGAVDGEVELVQVMLGEEL